MGAMGITNKRLRPCRILAMLLLTMVLNSAHIQGQTVAVVMSSDLPPYLEALAAFQSSYTDPIHRIDAGEAVPDGARVVVAIGGKAALQSYPDEVMLVYCLAPGVDLEARARARKAVRVAMVPAADQVLSRLKRLHPALVRLGVFWVSDAQQAYINALGSAGQSANVTVVVARIGGLVDLPEELRRLLRGGINALYLPPDPALISAQSFEIFRAFSQSNNVPLYAPSIGLVEKGAVASVACSFEEVGRTAGQVVHRVLFGDAVPAVVYPERVVFRVSAAAAAATGLKVDRAMVEQSGGEVR